MQREGGEEGREGGSQRKEGGQGGGGSGRRRRAGEEGSKGEAGGRRLERRGVRKRKGKEEGRQVTAPLFSPCMVAYMQSIQDLGLIHPKVTADLPGFPPSLLNLSTGGRFPGWRSHIQDPVSGKELMPKERLSRNGP